MSSISYSPPPVCEKFMLDPSFIRLIAGPVGSGKTTACIFELFRRASEQMPAQDGYRYTRFAIVRQTLAQLKMTVLKDVLQWMRGFATWKVSESTIYVEVGDIRSEWIFVPLEDPEDQRRLLSSQLTGAWISECIEIDLDLVPSIDGRCGRYPGANLGGCTWSGIIMDTNFPEEGGAWHEIMELKTPKNWAIFMQPGGMEPNAENLDWLVQTPASLQLPEGDPRRLAQGRTYYERLCEGKSAAWIDRYVHAKYGIDPSGRAVYADTFKATTPEGYPWHVVPSLTPIPGCTLLIGQDFGRDPCALLTQVDPMGRFLVLEEVMSLRIGLELHLDTRLRPILMQPRYFGLPIAIIGDPSGVAKSSLYEITSFDMLKQKGFHAFPAPTNDTDPRIRAFESWLLQARGTGAAMQVDGGRCPTFIRGMKMGYRYNNVKSTGEPAPKPLKNSYSHIVEAGQYAALAAIGGALGAINRRMVRRGRQGPTQSVSAAGWT